MDKAILVIDMPECCDECRFLNDSHDYPECIVTGETKGYTFRIREQKMDRCPLKPAPELQDVWHDDDDWIIGYNNCVHEIMGDYK